MCSIFMLDGENVIKGQDKEEYGLSQLSRHEGHISSARCRSVQEGIIGFQRYTTMPSEKYDPDPTLES